MSYYLLNIIYKGVLKMKKCDLTKNKVKYISLLTETSDKLPILDPYIAIQVLCDYLLGTDYYIYDPVRADQAIMIIVSEIINKYAKRELKRDMKRYDECNC